VCERRTRHGDFVSIDYTHGSRTDIGRTLHALVRHHVWVTGGKLTREFNRKWGDLARYELEVSNGIVHSPELAAQMERKWAAWEAEHWQ
jgi:hypothetical protein